MPVESHIDARRIRQRIDAAIQNRTRAIVAQLFYIGEECLGNARSNHLYLNQTGNLCSSIGYCVIVDGQVVHEGEWKGTAGKQGNGEEGKQKGMEYLHRLAAEQPGQGITFMMVAGMPYAEYVEAMSLDVLDTSQQMAETKIKDMLKRLFRTTA